MDANAIEVPGVALPTKHALRRSMWEKYGSWMWSRRTRNTKDVRVALVLAYRELRRQLNAGQYVDEKNVRGNIVYRDIDADLLLGFRFGDRHGYDRRLLAQGWEQWDTTQDASYFGCWIHTSERRTMCYVEGDRVLVQCPDEDSFAAELADMERFYGPAPEALRYINPEGQVTRVFTPRPTA